MNNSKIMNLVKKFWIFFVFVSIFPINSAFGDCAPSSLQQHYDSADLVFSGNLILKESYEDDLSQKRLTFNIQESFKGFESEQIIVNHDENYDVKFNQGLDYIVFAHGTQQPFEVDLCDFQYYAFPSVINLVSQLDNPENSIGHIPQYEIPQYLSEPEKIQLETLSEDFAVERQKERDRMYGQLMLIGIPAVVGLSLVIIWMKTLKSK